MHIAVSVHSAYHKQHAIWGQDRIWIKKEQMFLKKELNIVDTYTSFIITTHELYYHYRNKNNLYFNIE